MSAALSLGINCDYPNSEGHIFLFNLFYIFWAVQRNNIKSPNYVGQLLVCVLAKTSQPSVRRQSADSELKHGDQAANSQAADCEKGNRSYSSQLQIRLEF